MNELRTSQRDRCGYRERGEGGIMSDFDTLADRIREEAAQASRAGQMERLESIAREVERLRSGAKTLGETIEQQCRMVLDATGLHHFISEDGDGDWGAVWENLFDLCAKGRDFPPTTTKGSAS